MRRTSNAGDGRFRRRWVWGTTLGWFAGFLGGFIVASGFVDLVGFGPVQAVFAYSILGLFLGSVVGLIQWRVIRKRVAGTFLWVAASAAGMAVAGGAGYGIAVLIFGYSEDLEGLGTFGAVLGWTLVAACGGALTGALQSRAMRRHSPWAGWWVVASTVGWGLSMAVAGTVIVMASRLVGEPDPGVVWFFAAALIAGGATLGLFTGSAIVRLLTQPTTWGAFERLVPALFGVEVESHASATAPAALTRLRRSLLHKSVSQYPPRTEQSLSLRGLCSVLRRDDWPTGHSFKRF